MFLWVGRFECIKCTLLCIKFRPHYKGKPRVLVITCITGARSEFRLRDLLTVKCKGCRKWVLPKHIKILLLIFLIFTGLNPRRVRNEIKITISYHVRLIRVDSGSSSSLISRIRDLFRLILPVWGKNYESSFLPGIVQIL